MILTEKRSGKIKGRYAYNGKPTRVWTEKNEKSLPTVLVWMFKFEPRSSDSGVTSRTPLFVSETTF